MVLICYSLWEKWMYNEDMKISKIVVLLFYAENTEKAISRSFNINSMRPGYAFIIFIVQLSSSKWGRNSQNHFVLNVIKLLHFKTLSTIAFLKKQFKYIQRKTRMNAQLVWAYTITYNAMSPVPWAIKWWGGVLSVVVMAQSGHGPAHPAGTKLAPAQTAEQRYCHPLSTILQADI